MFSLQLAKRFALPTLLVLLSISLYLYIQTLKEKIEFKDMQIATLEQKLAYNKETAKKESFEAEWNATEPIEHYKEYDYEITENDDTDISTIEFIKLQPKN